ncbi:MAG: hypothetical protein Q8J85_12920 [Sulfuricurvum sp.]|nr:hypothetical protein [Sulfuricurvum sp.]MDP3023313.1 hypothetical protein [Sulfuricurvum sp.]
MIKTTILVLMALIFLIGCSDINFMGAKKYIDHTTYVERWFLNPDYDVTIPQGTEFYGASANKIKDKFIIKYYISDKGDSTIEIPLKDMWKVKLNGKSRNEQDDDNLFYYEKNSDGLFVKSGAMYGPAYEEVKGMPIKECYDGGWCELYQDYHNRILYVKKSILYQ